MQIRGLGNKLGCMASQLLSGSWELLFEDGESCLGPVMSSFVLALGRLESAIITLLVGSIIRGLGAAWVPQTLSQ